MRNIYCNNNKQISPLLQFPFCSLTVGIRFSSTQTQPNRCSKDGMVIVLANRGHEYSFPKGSRLRLHLRLCLCGERWMRIAFQQWENRKESATVVRFACCRCNGYSSLRRIVPGKNLTLLFLSCYRASIQSGWEVLESDAGQGKNAASTTATKGEQPSCWNFSYPAN